jgi:AcrR family transcriptional regulator
VKTKPGGAKVRKLSPTIRWQVWMTVTYAPSGRPRSPRIDAAALAAARSVVSEVGYRDMTMQSVAARAGIGKQTLYRRWPRKPLLVLTAVLGSERALEDQLPDLGSFGADVAAITARQLSIYETPRFGELIGGLLADCLAEPELLVALRAAFIEPRLIVLGRVVARTKARGEVGDDLSTNTVATTVAGAMLAACLVFGSADKTFASELALLIQRGAR